MKRRIEVACKKLGFHSPTSQRFDPVGVE